MRIHILLSILFELLEKGRLTADYLSKKYEISPRTVYRYVETLSPFVPLHVKRGRGGGICLADNYRLPVGFITKADYAALDEALTAVYAQTGNSKFLYTKRKFTSQARQTQLPAYVSAEIGEITILPDEKDKERCTLLRILQECIREKRIAEILLRGEKSPRKTEPVSLLLQQNEWKLFAFCYKQRNFVTLPLSSLRGAKKTEETFHPRSVHFALPMYATNVVF
jgi:predicted DNA-binding transcriptional regulator YafY